jgi:putative ubiquitin-RnfH superfamily antitoxin RatB of RatAB toxin-antitoxin module
MSDHAARAVLRIEIVYALPQREWLRQFELPPGSTIADAVQRSGLREEIPGLEVDDASVGIFGRAVTLDTLLRDGDRLELYRPLQCDPKQVRRERAARTAPRRR